MSSEPSLKVCTVEASVHQNDTLMRLLKSLANTSLSQGNFTDVCLYAYSRRLRTGHVGAPCPVYANSALLKSASPYFEDLFSRNGDGSRIETPSSAIANTVIKEDDFSADDSDLEDEDEDSLAELCKSDDEVSIISSLGSTSISDVTKVSEPSVTAPSTGAQSRPVQAMQNVRSIALRDAALVTWEALLYFIYTGEVAFAPLKSQGVRSVAISAYKREFPDRPAPCSPKSMYRLADLTGLISLKALALNNIRLRLSPSIISTEMFSRFSSKYTEVLEAEVTYLVQNRGDPTIIDTMKRALGIISREKVPHAAYALERMYDICIAGPRFSGSSLTPEFGTATPATLEAMPPVEVPNPLFAGGEEVGVSVKKKKCKMSKGTYSPVVAMSSDQL